MLRGGRREARASASALLRCAWPLSSPRWVACLPMDSRTWVWALQGRPARPVLGVGGFDAASRRGDS
eukprot:4396591-Pyramimonas_sp.AAC.1